MATIAILAAILLVSFAATALFLRLGARWVRAAQPTFARALIATIIMWLISIGAALLAPRLTALLSPQGKPTMAMLLAEFALAVAPFLLEIAVIIGIIAWIVRTSLPRAALVLLVSAIPGFSVLAFVLIIARPFILEAFVAPTNSKMSDADGRFRIHLISSHGGRC